jgi:hypothetical protein
MTPRRSTLMLDQTLFEVFFQKGGSYTCKSDQVVEGTIPLRNGLQVRIKLTCRCVSKGCLNVSVEDAGHWWRLL